MALEYDTHYKDITISCFFFAPQKVLNTVEHATEKLECTLIFLCFKIECMLNTICIKWF